MIAQLNSKRIVVTIILLLALNFGLPGGQCAAQTATIYYGNSAQFGSDATNPASNQGFTRLRDRWTLDGVPTTITDVFSVPLDCCIFFATAPTDPFSPIQVATLQAFVNSGGTFIISQDGSATPAMNQLLSDLGSSMQLIGVGLGQGPFTQLATVVNSSHPFMTGLSVGDNMYTYSPHRVSGGTALIDYPIGTHLVSVESIGLGTVMAVADYDLLNNAVGGFFPNDATSANNVVFWDNIAVASCIIPEPSGLLLAGLGLVGLGSRRRPA